MAITFVSAFIDSYTILPNKIQLYLIVCTEKKDSGMSRKLTSKINTARVR